jgi:hypothetical protein
LNAGRDVDVAQLGLVDYVDQPPCTVGILKDLSVDLRVIGSRDHQEVCFRLSITISTLLGLESVLFEPGLESRGELPGDHGQPTPGPGQAQGLPEGYLSPSDEQGGLVPEI